MPHDGHVCVKCAGELYIGSARGDVHIDYVFLQPGKGARCCVNGKPETTEVEIKHNNRVWLGNNYGFRFAFPGKEDDGDKFEEGVVADYLMAEEELEAPKAPDGGTDP